MSGVQIPFSLFFNSNMIYQSLQLRNFLILSSSLIFCFSALSSCDFFLFSSPEPLGKLYKLLFLLEIFKTHSMISNLSYSLFFHYVLVIFLTLYFIIFVMFTTLIKQVKTKKIILFYNQILFLIFIMILFTIFLLILDFNWNYYFSLIKNCSTYENFQLNLFSESDNSRLLLILITLLFGFFGLIMSKRSLFKHQNSTFFLIFLLGILVGCIGMIISNDWLFLYLNLELMTFCFLFLIAIQKNVRSIEAAIKYFFISAFSSFFLLYGLSYIYFIFGTLDFKTLECFLSSPNSLQFFFNDINSNSILQKSLLLIIISFAIKLGAAPFHMWVPDVYEGSPSFSTIFLIILPKIPTFSVLIYLIFGLFYNFLEFFQLIFFFLGIFSLFVGSLGALRQTRLKRLLAYSSVADTGFLFLGLSTGSLFGLQSVFFYLFLYSFFSVIIWGLIIWFESQLPQNHIITRTDLISGKYTSGLILLPLLSSLIGLPPFIGFWSKWVILLSAIKAQLFLGVLFFILGSIISSFYYLRILKISFFEKTHLNLKWLNNREQDFIFLWCISFLSVLLLYLSIDPNFLLLICQKIVLNLIFVAY